MPVRFSILIPNVRTFHGDPSKHVKPLLSLPGSVFGSLVGTEIGGSWDIEECPKYTLLICTWTNTRFEHGLVY